MREHRFIGDFDMTRSEVRIDNPEQSSQITKVLRLKEGDTIILSDGAGSEARLSITETGPTVRGAIIERWENQAEPARNSTLYAAVVKRDNFEWIAQKATEVGVKTIVPLATERTVKQSFKPERIYKIMHEAAEQSGRGIVPELGGSLSLSEAFSYASSELRFFFDGSGEAFAPSNHLPYTSADIFIGPEGGFSEAERASARDAGCLVVSLGNLTLRAETAAVIAAYRTVAAV